MHICNINKIDMKKILLSITLIALVNLSFAGEKDNNKKVMTKTLTFTVVDNNNESIAGAEIALEALGTISYTDMEGNYKIEIPSNSNEILTISFISFKDKKININDIKNGKITLLEE